MYLEQAVSIDPKFFEWHCLVGEAYAESGRLWDAVEAFGRAFRPRPDDTGAHLKLGLAYVAVNDWNAALDELQMLRTLDEVAASQFFDKIVYSFNYEMFEGLFNQMY